MENPLMDKNAVASYIGGITPRVARELMKTMPCVNVATGTSKEKLRVRLSDLEEWLKQRTVIHINPASEKKVRAKRNPSCSGEWLDDKGHVPVRRKNNGT